MIVEGVCPECDEDVEVRPGWVRSQDPTFTCPSCKTLFEWECDEFGGADLVLMLTRI